MLIYITSLVQIGSSAGLMCVEIELRRNLFIVIFLKSSAPPPNRRLFPIRVTFTALTFLAIGFCFFFITKLVFFSPLLVEVHFFPYYTPMNHYLGPSQSKRVQERICNTYRTKSKTLVKLTVITCTNSFRFSNLDIIISSIPPTCSHDDNRFAVWSSSFLGKTSNINCILRAWSQTMEHVL